MRSKDGEGSARLRQAVLPRSAALSQKAALRLPLPSTTPPRENGIAERPQALRYPENKNLIPLFMRKANAARILNRPALTQSAALRAQARSR